MLGIPVERPTVTETTAWGAAALAGLAIGVWQSLEQIAAVHAVERRFEPQMSATRRSELLRGWGRAVERAKGWATE
jgi:glycerol kinase